MIDVLRVVYTPTDYQPEGVAAAMIQWAAAEFGFRVPTITMAFDREANRYVVTF